MTVKRLRLNTLGNSRGSLTRLIRSFHSDQSANIDRFKAVMNAMHILLSYFKAQAEMEISERVETLESRITELEGTRWKGNAS